VSPKKETPALSPAGRRAADAVLEAAKFKPTSDGKRRVRQFDVHGMQVTEWKEADSETDTTQRDLLGGLSRAGR
jgi:hypothetical protein